jgi:hypothetical protein
VKLTIHFYLVPRSKNAWSCTSTPPIRLHGVVLVKHRDNFNPLRMIKSLANYLTSPNLTFYRRHRSTHVAINHRYPVSISYLRWLPLVSCSSCSVFLHTHEICLRLFYQYTPCRNVFEMALVAFIELYFMGCVKFV